MKHTTHEIQLKRGGTFLFETEEKLNCGARWEVVGLDPFYVSLKILRMGPKDPNVIGGPSRALLEFCGLFGGKTSVTLQEVRPFDRENPFQTMTFEFTIQNEISE